MNKNKTIIIVGGGHAGIEASHACLNMGLKVLLFILDPLAIGRMSCNPSIGGLAKGHLVKEIDALGGIMGYAADHSCLQFKTLNKSKGRAVWGPRAQVDKVKYSAFVSSAITNHKNITIINEEVVDIVVNKNKATAVLTKNKNSYSGDSIIITTGTFLSGIIHIGNENFRAGRLGEKPSFGLTDSIVSLGFETGRLKTGTPPRADSDSINWKKLEPSYGDNNPFPFSYKSKRPYSHPNIPSFIAHTNAFVHDMLKANLDKSPMYSGKIRGVGPRYCPSVEDKIVRFEDKNKHQLYLEPEWKNSNQIYINGFSTSMPKKIQLDALRSIEGLEKIKLIRPGYAIEYDYFPTRQLKATLETKEISNLYFAGQVNGTSGYEEAAAQGLIAGINAALKTKNLDPFHIKRNMGYIGVLIDDLITSSINEPYRMFTSSAEYRLSLRADTAPLRLTELGYKAGTVSKKQLNHFLKSKNSILKIEKTLKSSKILRNNEKLLASKFLCRPEVSIKDLFADFSFLSKNSKEDLFTAETNIKYEGYVSRETSRAKTMLQNEKSSIPSNIKFHSINGLSSEAKEKLSLVRPENIGQASRIGGVKPSDIMVLDIFLKQQSFVSRET